MTKSFSPAASGSWCRLFGNLKPDELVNIWNIMGTGKHGDRRLKFSDKYQKLADDGLNSRSKKSAKWSISNKTLDFESSTPLDDKGGV